MKVVLTDNYNRDNVADRLFQENLDEDAAKKVAKDYNDSHANMNWDWWAEVKPDDYKLYNPYD